MSKKTEAKRSANFTPEEILILAAHYQENRAVLQSSDGKSDSNQRKQAAYQQMTEYLNAQFPNTASRMTKQVQEKIKWMLKQARNDPHAKKVNPTGGGSPLPPIQDEWLAIMVEIVRDNPATTGVEGFESGMREEEIEQSVAVIIGSRSSQDISSPFLAPQLINSGSLGAGSPSVGAHVTVESGLDYKVHRKRPRIAIPIATPTSSSQSSASACGAEGEQRLEVLQLEKSRLQEEMEYIADKWEYLRLKNENKLMQNAILRKKCKHMGIDVAAALRNEEGNSYDEEDNY